MLLSELLFVTFIAAALTDLACGLGPLPLFLFPNISERVGGALTAAAAGMMTSASLVQLVGEGLQQDGYSALYLVAGGLVLGAVFFALASRWLDQNQDFDLGSLREKGGPGALLIVAAMTVHSLPEGVAIGVGYGSGDYSVGLPVALAIAVHNIPEGLAIALALRPKGVSTLACVGWAIFSSLPQPIAAVPAAWAVWLSEPLLPIGMGFAAGAMMYLVVSDLLPDAHEKAGNKLAPAAFLAGLAAMIVLGRVVGLS